MQTIFEISLLRFTAVKLVYFPLRFLFPTKIPDSIDESWEIRIKIHSFPQSTLDTLLFRRYVQEECAICCADTVMQSLGQVYLITVSAIIGHLTLKVLTVISAERKPFCNCTSVHMSSEINSILL